MTRVGQSVGQLSLLAAVPNLEPERPVLRVVIPCSRRKSVDWAVAARAEVHEHRAEGEARLDAHARPARDMYTGRAFKRALKAVERFADRRPDLPVALHIASARYGFVAADDQLAPYDAIMGANRRQWVDCGQALDMPTQAKAFVESSEVTVFALSQPYFYGAALGDLEPSRGFAVMIGVSDVVASPHRRDFHAGRREARALETAEREVAAAVLERLLAHVTARGLSAVHDLPADPLEWPPP